MKFKKALSVLLALLLVVSCSAAAFAAGAGERSYENSVLLAEGLAYSNVISYKSGSREESRALTLTAGGDARAVVMACDTIYGGMTVSTAVGYAESQGYNVLAAVNTDFFEAADRVPTGIVVENGIYKSYGSWNPAFCFDAEGGAFIVEDAVVAMTLSGPGGEVSLQNYNKSRGATGLMLFSEYFSTVSTRTSGDGWFVTFRILSGEMTVSGELELEVTGLSNAGGSVPIGEGNLVLTAAATAELGDIYAMFSLGDKVTLTTACRDERLAGAAWATGGGDVVVRDGEVTDSANWNKEVVGVHPRTAIGIKADGSVLIYTIDGRSAAYSNGLNLTELAEELRTLGCVTAMNMDGGGSTAIRIRVPGTDDYSTLNRPSDGEERRCATYLLLVTDAAGETAEHLYLRQDGELVMTGASLPVELLASDGAYRAAELPGEPLILTLTGLGSVRGGVYKAGARPGIETLSLICGEAAGGGTLHVTDTVDALLLTDGSGKSVSSITLNGGESLELGVSAYKFGRPVATDGAVELTVTGAVGSIEGYTFTASEFHGATGVLSVSCGGKTLEIPVKIRPKALDIAGHWGEEYIKTLYDLGIVEGDGDMFRPDDGMKRCDFTLMLWHAAGSPAANAGSGFTDVAADAYYARAVSWAKSTGIVEGLGDGSFAPQRVLTRQEAFTMAYRAFAALGVTAEDGDVFALAAFTDADAFADWAVTPTATLVGLGVVSGDGGSLEPSGGLTRAAMAKLLCLLLSM